MLGAAYYQAIGSKGGLDAIVLYDLPKNPDPIRYEFTGNTRTYYYDFTLCNLGDSTQTFQVKYIDHWLTRRSPDEVLLREGNGKAVDFTLSPGQRQQFTGEFTAIVETDAASGSGTSSTPSFVLQNETGRHSQKIIKKPPKNSFWR